MTAKDAKGGPDIDVRRVGASFEAKFKGDRRKPRPVGRGDTWKAAAADLLAKHTLH